MHSVLLKEAIIVVMGVITRRWAVTRCWATAVLGIARWWGDTGILVFISGRPFGSGNITILIGAASIAIHLRRNLRGLISEK